MIPAATVAYFFIALFFTLFVPIILILVLGIKKKITALPMLLGFAAFFVSQIVLRIPLLSLLGTMGWYQSFAGMFIPFALMLSFTAGLFEESARLGGAYILKKQRSYKDVISFGLGHGLCEVIFLIGMAHVNNIILSLAINSGSNLVFLLVPADMVEAVTAQLVAVEPFHIFLGVIERVFAVVFHIFATVLVFQGVIRKKIWYFFLAILAHTVLNFSAVLAARYVGILASEIVMFVLAALCGVYVLKSRKWFLPAQLPGDSVGDLPQVV